MTGASSRLMTGVGWRPRRDPFTFTPLPEGTLSSEPSRLSGATTIDVHSSPVQTWTKTIKIISPYRTGGLQDGVSKFWIKYPQSVIVDRNLLGPNLQAPSIAKAVETPVEARTKRRAVRWESLAGVDEPPNVWLHELSIV
jgi:hypothetical protein